MKYVRLAIMFSAVICAFSSCTKKNDIPPSLSGSNPSAVPIVPARSYPIYGRDGDTVAIARIDGERGGVARVHLQVLDQWMFTSGQTYDAAIYNGPYYYNIYAPLNTLTSDTATWTTFPVKDVNGKILQATDVMQSGLRIKINAPYETVGIGVIN